MIEFLPGQGLMYRPAWGPTDTTPRGLLTYAREVIVAAVAEAEDWLIEHGSMTPWELASTNLAARTVIAWWTQEFGFVQETHPDAQLVVVVNIPMPDVPPSGPAEPEPIPADGAGEEL
ncbi:hypothetical protein ACQP1V_36210 [Microtetraspora malaysiensis]|uniref:hypothetical protein n=1 Tax=Microtetraspora malaysiensis TaxID=161358 RepID=UPI003D8D0515